jgi:flagellar protein FlaG
MALEAIFNSVNHEAIKPVVKPVVKPRVETMTDQVTSETTINITELPVTSRVANINESYKEQAYSKNQDNGSTQQEGLPTEQQLKEAVSKVNSKLKMHRTKCEFSYHEETKRVSIKVLDKETNEVIREIPPEQTLEMVQKAWELAGFLVDERR